MIEEALKEFDSEFHIQTVETNEFGITHIFPLDDEGRMFVPDVSDLKGFIRAKLNLIASKAAEVTGDTSDGYHTFNELYEFRKLYNAALFNEWAMSGDYNIHKSKKHHDGEPCFGGGWFIVMATLPTGQISNHYELKDWDLFRCEEREIADEWDGHTAQDVMKRLSDYLNQEAQSSEEKVI